jgi:zinc protease
VNALLLGLVLAAAPATTGSPADLPLPKLSSTTLENGLRVLAFERHEQPVFIARLAIPAGLVAEPPGKSGLANFTAGVLTKGTATRSADVIIEWLDTHGAELTASASEDFTVVSARGRSRDLEEVLDLLAESVLKPSFPKDEVERLRPQLEALVRQRFDDPAELADLHADYLLYGQGHPFGRTETLASIAAIDQAAIAAFYQAHYRPNGAVLVLAGDFDAEKVLRRVRLAFAGWARKEPAAVPKVAPLAKPRIRVVNKPDATQAQIRLVHAMPARGNPDTYAIKVMNSVLGTGFGSRLVAAIRNKEGKTYRISSSVSETATTGHFGLTTFTRTAEVANTLQSALRILAGLKQDGPTEDELARARGMVGGGFVVANSDMRALAASLLDAEAYGLGADYVRTFRSRVQAVTVGDAKAAAAKYLSPSAFAVVLVGNGKQIVDQVKSAFPGVEVELREASGPVADEERPRVEKAAPAEVTKGREVFAAAVEAVGGTEALRQALAGVVAEGTMAAGPGGEQTVPFTARWVGDKQRVELRAPGQTQVMVLTPDAAFAVAGSEVKSLPAAMAAQQRVRVLLNYPNVLRLPERPDVEVAFVRDDVREDDGTKVPVQVVEVRQKQAEGEPVVLARLHFDARTHLPYGYLLNASGRQELLRFMDFQKQGPLLFPMKQRVRINGQQASVVTLDRVTFRAVPEEQFAPPK